MRREQIKQREGLLKRRQANLIKMAISAGLGIAAALFYNASAKTSPHWTALAGMAVGPSALVGFWYLWDNQRTEEEEEALIDSIANLSEQLGAFQFPEPPEAEGSRPPLSPLAPSLPKSTGMDLRPEPGQWAQLPSPAQASLDGVLGDLPSPRPAASSAPLAAPYNSHEDAWSD